MVFALITDQRHVFDLIPFILKEEEARVRKEITGKDLSIISDGTSRLGEALAVIVHLWEKSGHWSIAWFACRCQ